MERLDIDFAGFIFYKSSPRYVGDKISKKEIKSADFDIKKVGVFVNPEYDEVMTLVYNSWEKANVLMKTKWLNC